MHKTYASRNLGFILDSWIEHWTDAMMHMFAAVFFVRTACAVQVPTAEFGISNPW